VSIEGCGFSATVIQSLQAACEARETTSRFRFSMVSTNLSCKERSTEVLLEELYSLVSQEQDSLVNISRESRSLNSWLNRLCLMADYQVKGDLQKDTASNVLDYLKKANEDSGFREIFMAVIDDAAETCGDRMALSVLKLGIAHQVASIDLSKIKRLASFLQRGVWALELLETVARQKVEVSRFVDEIEVFLAYPLMLKNRLDLPINTKKMLYFSCSQITISDLDNAEKFVRDHFNNQDAFCTFLIKQDVWKRALGLKFEMEVEGIKIAMEQASETSEGFDEIEESWLMLTRKSLGYKLA
jgi:hypothetical protein